MTKKEKLLLSAKKLFAAQGFDKTSIREIANDAQVNSSMISYYFGGKDGMIEGIFDHFFPKISQEKLSLEPNTEIEYILKSIISLRLHDTELIDILHSEIILKSSRLETIKPYILTSWTRLYQLLDLCKNKQTLNIQSTDVAYMYLLAGISFPYHNDMFQLNQNHITINEEFVTQIVHMLMKGLN